MFSVLAQLSENFIFIYLGLNLFTQDVQVFKPLFILVATVSQFLVIFSESHCAYAGRRDRHSLPRSIPVVFDHQHFP